jgi:hypothetical protein
LSQAALDTFCSALPDAPQLFDVVGSLHSTEEIALRCSGNDELAALACVAAARLFDTGPVAHRHAAPGAVTAASAATTADAGSAYGVSAERSAAEEAVT